MVTPSRPSPAPRRRRKALVQTAIAAGVAAVAATLLAIVAFVSGGDPADATPATAGAAEGAAGDADSAAGTVHEHHVGDALPGCDQDQMHAAMMMFNPSVADELLTGTCPWPYDATIAIAGGVEDPSIVAAFEPHRYQDLFDLFTSLKYGTCSVSTLADPRVDGFVFGFEVGLRPGGCGQGDVSVQFTIREYVTRAWRDTAASQSVATSSHVLGRWVVGIDGSDAGAVAQLAAALAALDAG